MAKSTLKKYTVQTPPQPKGLQPGTPGSTQPGNTAWSHRRNLYVPGTVIELTDDVAKELADAGIVVLAPADAEVSVPPADPNEDALADPNKPPADTNATPTT